MKRWRRKYRAWKLRQKERTLQHWGQERLDGMARFVLRTTLTTSMGYLTASEIISGKAGFGTIIFWHVVGLGFGVYKWMSNETNYQLAIDTAKHQQRMNANNATYAIGIHPRLKNVKS